MNRTDSPAKQAKPFGINGPREPLLATTPAGDNTASYDSGFPPITMALKSAGGLPPKGQDINQILYELSALGRWASTGAKNAYDSAFAAAIGGYPSGSYVLGDDLKTVFRCTIDGNTANPNTTTTGWAKAANDISDILGLGTAATKNVGSGTGQIPDMSFFASQNSDTGYQKLPSGIIIQWGLAAGTLGVLAQKAYPIAFPNAALHVFMCHNVPNDVNGIGLSGARTSGSTTTFEYMPQGIKISGTTVTAAAAGSAAISMHFFAIGY